MTTTPTPPRDSGFLRLPVGTVTFRVQAVNTQKVRFLLSPTGTNTSARLLGEDTNGRDGWALAWRCQDEPLTAHLTVKAIGLGGTSLDTVLSLYTPNPTADTANADAVPGSKDRSVARCGPAPVPPGAGSHLPTAAAGPSPRQPRPAFRPGSCRPAARP